MGEKNSEIEVIINNLTNENKQVKLVVSSIDNNTIFTETYELAAGHTDEGKSFFGKPYVIKVWVERMGTSQSRYNPDTDIYDSGGNIEIYGKKIGRVGVRLLKLYIRYFG